MTLRDPAVVSPSRACRSESSAPHPARRPCPRCGSTQVDRSHRRGFAERALSLLGLKIRRCHGCNLRFARLGSSAIWIEDVESLARKLAFLALMVAGTALLLALVAWLSVREAAF